MNTTIEYKNRRDTNRHINYLFPLSYILAFTTGLLIGILILIIFEPKAKQAGAIPKDKAQSFYFKKGE